MNKKTAGEIAGRRQEVVLQAERLAAGWAASPALFTDQPPQAQLQELHAAGFFTHALPHSAGGLGLGTEPGGHLPLLRVLAALGGADLPLGRLFEGHVNALILIEAYGTASQRRQAAADAARGLLFGVWNTGEGPPMRFGADLTLEGCKGFATGAAFVQRPIITAEHGGWQMVLPRMEEPAVAEAVRVDGASWQPFGMVASASHTIDFTGARVGPEDLIGAGGDLYRDPLFRGGAVRFAAVQAGAVLALSRRFTGWLQAHHRAEQPYQIARAGEIALAAQEAALWIERAAAVAEQALWPEAAPEATRHMVSTANMTRLAIERLATATMGRVIAGVGAHGLLHGAGFERTLRDLTMYLRQPNPDGALADLGRDALTGSLEPAWSANF